MLSVILHKFHGDFKGLKPVLTWWNECKLKIRLNLFLTKWLIIASLINNEWTDFDPKI